MADIITCPACQRKLQVPETFLGQTVQCPECRHTFVAGSDAAPATGVQASAPPPAPSSAGPPPAWQEPEPPRRRPRYEEDHDDDLDVDDRLRRPGVPHRGGSILA